MDDENDDEVRMVVDARPGIRPDERGIAPAVAPARDAEDDDEEDMNNADIVKQMMDLDPSIMERMDVSSFDSLLDFMSTAWCKFADMQDAADRTTGFFVNRREMDARSTHFTELIVALRDYIKANIHDKVAASQLNKRVELVRMAIHNSKQLFLFNVNLLNGGMYAQDQISPMPGDDNGVVIAQQDFNSAQKFMRFAINHCSKLSLRKHGTMLYKPVFTHDNKYTHSYEEYVEMMKFIHMIIFPYEQNMEMFTHLTNKASVPNQVVHYLQHCMETELPFIQKDRSRFSFRNGVYDADMDLFVEHGERAPASWREKVSCNYINADFEAAEYEREMADSKDPMDIQTPNIQKMFDSQQFSREVCRWIYAMLGRCLYDIYKHDKWQLFLFFKGTGGSGKSTIMHLFTDLYSPVDCGVLSTEASRTFPIEHLIDKFVWKIPDVNKTFTLNATIFNTMVSGEPMEITRKFKVSDEKVWKSQGIGAGNTYFPFPDDGGSSTRRILCVLYDHVVKNSDPMLPAKCKAELPRFLMKINRCYRQLAARYSTRHIWDEGILPQEFHDWKMLMSNNTNSIAVFLNEYLENKVLTLGPNEHVSWTALNRLYTTYTSENKLRDPMKFNSDVCAAVFQTFKLTIVKVPRNPDLYVAEDYDDYPPGSKYIKGISKN